MGRQGNGSHTRRSFSDEDATGKCAKGARRNRRCRLGVQAEGEDKGREEAEEACGEDRKSAAAWSKPTLIIGLSELVDLQV
jgi:hypothetical protein